MYSKVFRSGAPCETSVHELWVTRRPGFSTISRLHWWSTQPTVQVVTVSTMVVRHNFLVMGTRTICENSTFSIRSSKHLVWRMTRSRKALVSATIAGLRAQEGIYYKKWIPSKSSAGVTRRSRITQDTTQNRSNVYSQFSGLEDVIFNDFIQDDFIPEGDGKVASGSESLPDPVVLET